MRTTVTPLLVFAAACSSPRVDVGGPANLDIVALIRPETASKVDILFVVDDSGSMGPRQEDLAARAEDALFGVLAQKVDGPLDLHIGAVSTDAYAIEGVGACESVTDSGVLRNRMEASCAPDTRFVEYRRLADGSVEGNYPASLGDAFSCLVELGSAGCGFEAPLEAMREALDGSRPENEGFLRDDALLLVVLVTDEDDCSVFDRDGFFANQYADVTDPLGPLTSFRCFEFGVVCDEPDDPRALGPHTGCRPRDDSAFMPRVSSYADFLATLKDDPTMVLVSGIANPPEPVIVSNDSRYAIDVPYLESPCGGIRNGNPGVRLDGFLDGLPARHVLSPICESDLQAPLENTAKLLSGVMTRSPCLLGALADKSDAPGLQPSCSAYDVFNPRTPIESRTPLARCDEATDQTTSCFELIDDPGCDSASNLSVKVHRRQPAPEGSYLMVSCAP